MAYCRATYLLDLGPHWWHVHIPRLGYSTTWVLQARTVGTQQDLRVSRRWGQWGTAGPPVDPTRDWHFIVEQSAPTPHRTHQILPDDGSCEQARGTVTYCRAAYLFDDQVLVCVQHMRCAQALGLQGLQSCSIELQINTTKYSRERIRAGLGDSGLLPGRVSLRRLGCACLVRHPRLMTRNSRKLCGNRTELKLPGIEIYYTNYLISLAKNMLCSILYYQEVLM